jgi:hypothetical protein
MPVAIASAGDENRLTENLFFIVLDVLFEESAEP